MQMLTFLKTRRSKLACYAVAVFAVMFFSSWILPGWNALLRPDLVFPPETSRAEQQTYRKIYDVYAMMLLASELRIESRVLREKRREIWSLCESHAAVESSPRLKQRFLLLQSRWGSPPRGVEYPEAALKTLNECIGIDPDSLEGLLAKSFILEKFSRRREIVVSIRLDLDSLSEKLEEHEWEGEPFLPIATGYRMKSEFMERMLWKRNVLNNMQSQGLSYDDALDKTPRTFSWVTVPLFEPSPVLKFLVWVRMGFPSEYVDRSEL